MPVMTDHNPNGAKAHESTFIVYHFGQCGVQIGNAYWELFNLEHGIKPDGVLTTSDDNDEPEEHIAHCSFYHETSNGKHIPSCIFLDLESDVIDEIKKGVYRDLFHPGNLICGNEDAANNFARGFYSIGKDLEPPMTERTRKITEQSNKIRGFIFTHSIGGGTGSGFTASTLLDLHEANSKVPQFQFTIAPSEQLNCAVVEPYNALLHGSYSALADLNVIYDNESIYNLCRTKLKIKNPSYTQINRLVAQSLSNITLTERFSGQLNTDLSDLKTNLVPFPALHYPTVAIAPLIPHGKGDVECHSAKSMIRNVFEEDNLMVACPQTLEENTRTVRHKFFACGVLFRGDFQPREVHDTIDEFKPTIDVVNWCHTPFRIGMCPYPPIVPGHDQEQTDHGITLLSNTTAVSQVFCRLYNKFQRLYTQGAFLHWYEAEGMPASDWDEAQENVHDLLETYRDHIIEGEMHDKIKNNMSLSSSERSGQMNYNNRRYGSDEEDLMYWEMAANNFHQQRHDYRSRRRCY